MKAQAIALAVLFAAVPLLKADPLQDARARFQDGEFEQSAKLFEQALEKSPPSAAVFFELGRAWSKVGQDARAALNYRRALILDPRFLPARTALQEANTSLGIPRPKSGWRTRLLERVPMDSLTWAGAVLFWAGAFVILAAFFSARRRGRRVLLGGLSLVIGFGLVAIVWVTDPRITLTTTALVLTNGGTSLLRSPADNSEKVASLAQGSLIEVRSQRGRWFYGELPGGASGWFLTEGIIPLIPPA